MELRHIRYFLAVAEERNFTRAAQRLGLAQPPLSQQIRDLEAEIGTALFRRVPHGAELTEAGRVFRDQVKALPMIALEAADAARRAAAGQIGQVRLGVTGTAALNPLVPLLIRMFRLEHPGISLKLTEANSIHLREAVLDGRLDVAILRPSRTDPAELSTCPIASEALIAALASAEDPPPEQDSVRLASLAETPLILTPRSIGLGLHDAALEACRAAGFEPHVGQQAPQIVTILSLVSAGLGFSLVPASMRRLRLEGVTYKSLSGEPPCLVSISAAVRRGPLAPATQIFLSRAKSLSAGLASP